MSFRARDNDQLIGLAERSGFQPDAKHTQVLFAVGAASCKLHGFAQFDFGHAGAVIDDAQTR